MTHLHLCPFAPFEGLSSAAYIPASLSAPEVRQWHHFSAGLRARRRQRVSSLAASTVLFVLAFYSASSARVQGQAPGLAWRVNVGAQVFAVDAQTNVYANAGGTVITLTGAGATLSTNSICPVPGLAQRDASGNYYFAGQLDGTQDFGGITLVGGFTNSPGHQYQRGAPTCFLAKYGPGGNLATAVSFGLQGAPQTVTDAVLDPAGGCCVGYVAPVGGPGQWGFGAVSHIAPDGAYDWDWTFPNGADALKLGAVTPSSCCALLGNEGIVACFLLASPGTNTSSAEAVFPSDLAWHPLDWNSRPVVGQSNDVYAVGIAPDPAREVLRKFLLGPGEGSFAWDLNLTNDQCVLGSDNQGNLFLADGQGSLAKHDEDGTLLWSTTYGTGVIAMLVDSQNNRFLTFNDGSIGRLEDDPAAQAPAITAGPQAQTLFVGDSTTLAVTVSGTPALRYAWRLNATNLPGATANALALDGVTPAQAGSYSVVVSNAAGAVTSAPALVRVKSEEFYAGAQMLANGAYTFTAPPTLTIRSAFTNGSRYYTLDGTPPDFSSTRYTDPFQLTTSATVRAIGYSADFLSSEEADAVTATVPPQLTLAAGTAGGGSVALYPPGGTYAEGTAVLASASPAPGWAFISWLGDAAGGSTNTIITMNGNKTVQAVFGTTLSTTVAGQGGILLDPPGGLYPYGAVVRLTGVPETGNYFGAWGDAGTGSSNPLHFTVTNATPTVSSIFAALQAGQSALTVEINGPGQVTADPPANVYAASASVTLTAVPDAGHSFLSWSGDAYGNQNPLTLSMAQSRVVTASFLSRPVLQVGRPGEGMTSNGFSFTILSDPQLAWQVMVSTNLSDWTSLGTVTNVSGQMLFTDPAGKSARGRFYQARPGP
jgi:hypothetical protein